MIGAVPLAGTLMVVMVAACAPAGPDSRRRELDATTAVPAIRQATAAYLAAIARRDTGAVLGALPEDGRIIWIENGAVRYRSTDELLAGLSSIPLDATIETQFDSAQVHLLDAGAAHVWGAFRTTIGSPAMSYSFGGMISFFMYLDGEAWRISGGHVSSAEGDGR